jgi:hypothetical protein
MQPLIVLYQFTEGGGPFWCSPIVAPIPTVLGYGIECDDHSMSHEDHLDYLYHEWDESVFPMTIHTDVSGQPHVLLMHER